VPRLVIGARAGGKVKLDLTNLELTTGPAAGDAFPSPRRVVLFDRASSASRPRASPMR